MIIFYYVGFIRDLHSVSNMLAREFQTLILAQCSSEEGDQEQLLVGFLCNGPGLMLLEVLCILAYKVSNMFIPSSILMLGVELGGV